MAAVNLWWRMLVSGERCRRKATANEIVATTSWIVFAEAGRMRESKLSRAIFVLGDPTSAAASAAQASVPLSVLLLFFRFV